MVIKHTRGEIKKYQNFFTRRNSLKLGIKSGRWRWINPQKAKPSFQLYKVIID